MPSVLILPRRLSTTQLSKHQSLDLNFLFKPRRALDASLAVLEMIYFDYDQDSVTWLRGVLVRLVRCRFSDRPPDSVLPDQGILQSMLAVYSIPPVAQQMEYCWFCGVIAHHFCFRPYAIDSLTGHTYAHNITLHTLTHRLFEWRS